MHLDVFGREIREMIDREFAQKCLFFLQNEGSGVIYARKNDCTTSSAPSRAIDHPADVSSFGLLSVQISIHI